MAGGFTPEQLERLRHSEEHPAFEGTYEFDIAIEVLGTRVTRSVRAEYTYTPDWEYYDIHKRAPYVGWPNSGVGFSVLTVPKEDIWDDSAESDEAPEWVKCEAFGAPGVLPKVVWDQVDAFMDERAKVDDAERRRVAGLAEPDE